MALLTTALSGCGSDKFLQVTSASLKLAVSPQAISLPVGSSANTSVSLSGQTQAVQLSLAGLPNGVTGNFGANGSGGSVPLTLSAASTAAIGSYSVQITGTSGNQSSRTTVQVTLTQGSFTLSSSTPTLSLLPGSSASSTITLSSTNGFSGLATLAISGLPPGMSAVLSSPTLNTSSTSTVTFTASSSVAPGTYKAIVTGSAANVNAAVSISVVVTQPVLPSFLLLSSEGALSMPHGSTASAQIQVSAENGFNGYVSLAASGLPTGVTASFGPMSLTSGSTVTFAANNTAPAGTYNAVITGTSGTLTASTTIKVTVLPPASFTLSPSTATLSVQDGSSAAVAINVVSNYGFNGVVSLSSSNPPKGITVSFSAATATGSTATFYASSTVTPSSYPVTISGISGTLNASTTIIVTVPTPGFSLESSTSAVSLSQGSIGGSIITVAGTNGFSGMVSLSASGLPLGITASFTPSTTRSTSNVTLQATATALPGTYSVTINGTSGSQSASVSLSVVITQASAGTTWYVRQDGGSRYDANAPLGQCNGKSDAPYRQGSGVNQSCAFNDIRYLWDDQTYMNHAWVIQGGDTVVVQSCAANPNQLNPTSPGCRVGWDSNTGPGAGSTWCYGTGVGCINPPIPAGTAAQHTRIVGGCVLQGTCNNANTTNRKNLTQIIGGFADNIIFNLTQTQFVDVEGFEFTTHNGACSRMGSPAYPRSCVTYGPSMDDYTNNGLQTDNKTANLTLQDIYVDGLEGSGIYGPIGGPVIMNRVFVGFNAFAGWNFDDGHLPASTPDAPGSSITASYVTMEGNGCKQQYPITDPQFPALACWDSSSGGFGDSWSGQTTTLVSFTCDHCQQIYNTKDGFIGPHTETTTIKITNSLSMGNMGQQWKWGTTPNSSIIFENNLTVGNCHRMSEQIPGAAQNFNINTGLPGSYLSNFCRAEADLFSFYTNTTSSVLFAGNTIIAYNPVIFDLNCGTAAQCGSSPFVFKDNLILGYTPPLDFGGWGNGEMPTLYFRNDPSIVVQGSFNLEYGIRNGDTCGSNGVICQDPLLVDEPTQTTIPLDETKLDNFNFYPNTNSPSVDAGTPVPDLTTDYYGANRPATPTMGAVEPQ